MKVILKYDDNKETIEAVSSQELVEYLNDTAKFKSASPNQFMLDYSKRAVIGRDADIRATDSDSFVEDLIRIGDIEMIG